LILDCLIHDRIGIAENDTADATHPIDILVTVDVPKPGSLGPLSIDG
jgi:hypothetical protein